MLQVRKGVHRSLLLQADQAPGQPAQAVHGASYLREPCSAMHTQRMPTKVASYPITLLFLTQG